MDYQITERSTRLEPRYPNQIRRYRIQVGLSQKALGRKLGRTRNAVSSWERGQTFPRGITILRLAKHLDTLVETLYWDLYAADRFFEEDAA